MLVRIRHNFENAEDEVFGNCGVEEITHGINEDHARSLPPRGQIQLIAMQSESESGAGCSWIPIVLVSRVPHPLETRGQIQSVAVIASWTYLIAPAYRVPGGIGPLDRRLFTHVPECNLRNLTEVDSCNTNHRAVSTASAPPAARQTDTCRNPRVARLKGISPGN